MAKKINITNWKTADAPPPPPDPSQNDRPTPSWAGGYLADRNEWPQQEQQEWDRRSPPGQLSQALDRLVQAFRQRQHPAKKEAPPNGATTAGTQPRTKKGTKRS